MNESTWKNKQSSQNSANMQVCELNDGQHERVYVMNKKLQHVSFRTLTETLCGSV